jgi:predicted CopG family antitoxin
MAQTTISIDPEVRDRLKAYCGGGVSYSEAITRIMDLIEADRFFGSFRAALEDKKSKWVDEKDLEWD